LGHIGMSGLDTVIKDERVKGLNIVDSVDAGLCEDCLAGKQTRRPFNGVHEPEKEPGERQYLDMWGPSEMTSVGGKRWLFHIMD
ncbi:hypothetical protein C8R45DRAFT_768572, partial [Mycena sanguinolenta]